ncbi:MAG: hypothetical protein HQK55_15160 [Deltaproteobacteria bacterium]|nr:hypothetical protein [Deltaproteobacteria bacterium]
MNRSRFSAQVLIFALLILSTVTLAGAADVDEVSLIGTYRNLTPGSGSGENLELTPPLTLNPDHQYTWGPEKGQWSFHDGKVSLSERPAWGDASITVKGQLVFQFLSSGKQDTVTMSKSDK